MADRAYVDGGETENLSAEDQFHVWPGWTYLDGRTAVSYHLVCDCQLTDARGVSLPIR